jgi:protein-S-isoprenylcysteine O-methyltransferase Ste14
MKLFFIIYAFFYFGLAVGWRGWLVWKRTGINPLRLTRADDVHGFVVRSFKLTVLGLLAIGCSFVLFDDFYAYLVPIPYLENTAWLRITGYFLCVASLIWILIAQSQMGRSWRIGIDQENRTELVERGLYRFSRNPIFFGMLVSFVGVFCLIPNAALLALLSASISLVQVQVRLEEEHLLGLHGEKYIEFCRHVSRWFSVSVARQLSKS